ncbi:MAG: tetratricopeptide repeat protein, partial [Pseudomonadota bacterium]
VVPDNSLKITGIKLVPSVIFLFLLLLPNVHSRWDTQNNLFLVPAKATEFIEETNIKGKMFNSLEIGGYLIWSTFPERQVFYCDAQGFSDLLPTFIRAHVDTDSWSSLERRYAFDYALVAIKDHLDKYFSEKQGWYLVYWDNSFLLYVKKNGRNDDIIERFGYNWIKPSPSLSYLDIYLDSPNRASKVIKEFERALRFSPDFREGYSSLGYIYMKLGNLEPSLRQYLSLLSFDPRNISALTNIGVIKAKQGRLEEAIEYWKKVITIDSRNRIAKENIQKAKDILSKKGSSGN